MAFYFNAIVIAQRIKSSILQNNLMFEGNKNNEGYDFLYEKRKNYVVQTSLKLTAISLPRSSEFWGTFL